MPKVEPFEYQKSTNIDEHNQIVNKINEIVDTSNDMEQKVNDAVDLVNELDKEVDKATSDISQLKISDAEHTEQITHLDTVVDNHATEITALKAKDATIDTEISSLKTKDTQHDTEIQGLSESVVTDLVATFDNSSRKLSLSIEREQAESIDAVVTIPADGGGSGGSYSAGDGIAISDANVISVDDTVGKKSEIVALQNATKPAIKAIEVTETAEKVSITTTALDDATKITEDIGVVSDTKAGIVTPELKKKWDSTTNDSWTIMTEDTLFNNLEAIQGEETTGNYSTMVVKKDIRATFLIRTLSYTYMVTQFLRKGTYYANVEGGDESRIEMIAGQPDISTFLTFGLYNKGTKHIIGYSAKYIETSIAISLATSEDDFKKVIAINTGWVLIEMQT